MHNAAMGSEFHFPRPATCKRIVMRKTVAILGEIGIFFPELIKVLIKQDLQLLLVSEDEEKKLEISEQLELKNSTAEVEFLSCEKDGCWEADMIVLVNPDNSSSSLVKKIKEVATQKIVVVISEDKEILGKPDLQELLPWSKVVEIRLNSSKRVISLCSKDVEAKMEVKSIFQASGYQLK